MDKYMYIEQLVFGCTICQLQRPALPLVPIYLWSWPTTPRSRLHQDLACPFLGHMFLSRATCKVVGYSSHCVRSCVCPGPLNS